MQNYSDRLKKIREIHGFSQQLLADSIEDKQQNIARYESGKVKRISVDFANKISSFFNIKTGWILTGETNLAQSKQLNMHFTLNSGIFSKAEIAAKLRVPEDFIQAICDNEVNCSDDFFEKLTSAMKLPKLVSKDDELPIFMKKESMAFLEEQNQKLKLENARLQGNLDAERRHYEVLEAKYEELIKRKTEDKN